MREYLYDLRRAYRNRGGALVNFAPYDINSIAIQFVELRLVVKTPRENISSLANVRLARFAFIEF